MINIVLNTLKEKLNEYFRLVGSSHEDVVQFISSSNNDPISFTNDKVTPFLINVSEDRKFREADLFASVEHDGIKTQINPEVRIELLILFVSKFNDYNQALTFLSYIIKFFQANRVLTPLNSPQLAEGDIEKLVIELISLPLEEQNQVWHSLNTSYLPSLLFRIRLLCFMDEQDIQLASGQLSELQVNVNEI